MGAALPGPAGEGVTREGDASTPLSSHGQGSVGDRIKTKSLSNPGNLSIRVEEKDTSV